MAFGKQKITPETLGNEGEGEISKQVHIMPERFYAAPKKKNIGLVLIILAGVLVIGTLLAVAYYLNQSLNQAKTATPVIANAGINTNNNADTNVNPIACDNDFDCLINAAKNCQPAIVNLTATLELGQVKQTSSKYIELKGLTDGKCTYYERMGRTDIAFPAGTPQATIDQTNAIYKQLQDKDMTCKFAVADLLAMLQGQKDSMKTMSFSTAASADYTNTLKNAGCQGQYFDLLLNPDSLITPPSTPSPTPTSTPNANANLNANVNQNVNAPAPDEPQITPLPAAFDQDNDGLTALEEQLYGTDAAKADSDNDTYLDGEELLNNYDPTRPKVNLANSGLISNYSSKFFSLIYPKKWRLKEQGTDQMEVLFVSPQGEFVEMLILDNPNKMELKDWYRTEYPNADFNVLTAMRIGGLSGYRSPDERTYYFLSRDKSLVYLLNYNVGSLQETNFATTFAVMIKNLQLSR